MTAPFCSFCQSRHDHSCKDHLERASLANLKAFALDYSTGSQAANFWHDVLANALNDLRQLRESKKRRDATTFTPTAAWSQFTPAQQQAMLDDPPESGREDRAPAKSERHPPRPPSPSGGVVPTV